MVAFCSIVSIHERRRFLDRLRGLPIAGCHRAERWNNGTDRHGTQSALMALFLIVAPIDTETDNDPGCVKTLRGIIAPGILGSTVTRRAKKRKNLSSARHYDQIRFRFHTAKTQKQGCCPWRQGERRADFPIGRDEG